MISEIHPDQMLKHLTVLEGERAPTSSTKVLNRVADYLSDQMKEVPATVIQLIERKSS